MKLLDFFKPRQKPAARFEHPVLGFMQWVSSESEWEGSYNGYKFSIPREEKPEPSGELLSYAAALLGNSVNLTEALENEKRRWLTKYPGSAQEVQLLHFERFALYRYQRTCRAFVSLFPESRRNSWRMEFNGLQCEGLGFDS